MRCSSQVIIFKRIKLSIYFLGQLMNFSSIISHWPFWLSHYPIDSCWFYGHRIFLLYFLSHSANLAHCSSLSKYSWSLIFFQDDNYPYCFVPLHGRSRTITSKSKNQVVGPELPLGTWVTRRKSPNVLQPQFLHVQTEYSNAGFRRWKWGGQDRGKRLRCTSY